jgi:hypothetical protein
MNYLPSFRLGFPDGSVNEYRLRESSEVEFLTSDGTWRVLTADDVRLHYILHTEVAKWLRRALENANRTDAR